MEPEGSLPHSQASATRPYPGRAQSSPHAHNHFLEIHPNIIHHLHLGLPSGLSHSGFPTRTIYVPLFSPIRATCPAHLILLDFITRTILVEEYRPFSSSLCSLLHSPITSSLLGPNILLNTIFSDTLSFLSSLAVSDQASHPYKTTGKIIVLYILIPTIINTYKIYVYQTSGDISIFSCLSIDTCVFFSCVVLTQNYLRQ